MNEPEPELLPISELPPELAPKPVPGFWTAPELEAAPLLLLPPLEAT